MEIARERRKINLFCAIAIIIGFFVMFILPVAYAEKNPAVHAMADKVANAGIGIINEAISNGGEFSGLLNACTSDLEGWLLTAYNSLKIIGAMLAVAIAISHIFQNIDRNQDPVEAVFKSIIELIISLLFIVNLGDILAAIVKGGLAIIDYFKFTPTDTTSNAGDELLMALTNDTSGGFSWAIKATAWLLIPWVMSIFIDIAARFVIIQIMFEIIIRRMFAPLAVVDIYHEGFRSPGARYLKKLLATFIKLAICALVARFAAEQALPGLAASFSGGAGDVFDAIFAMVALNFACIGLMLKGGEYANDIVGA